MTELNFGLDPLITAKEDDDFEDQANLLSESQQNMEMEISSQEESTPRLITTKKINKNKNIIYKNYTKLRESFNKSKKIKKLYISIDILVILLNFIIKGYLVILILKKSIPKLSKLKPFIKDRIFNNQSYSFFYYIIDILFLLLGILFIIIEPFNQLITRFLTLVNIKNCSLKPIILSKCFYFLSLGLIPELIILILSFKAKYNIVLAFFKYKIINQPSLIFWFIIYIIITLSCRGGKTVKEKLIENFMNIKDNINEFIDSYIFVWNNYNEKNVLNEEENKKEKKEQKENNLLRKVKTVAEPINKMMNDDENEDNTIKRTKTPNEKEKKKENTMKNLFQKLKIGFEFLMKNNLFIIAKRWAIYIILASYFVPFLLNGIFDYGYYVFVEWDEFGCILFKVDIILTIIYGFFLILLCD